MSRSTCFQLFCIGIHSYLLFFQKREKSLASRERRQMLQNYRQAVQNLQENTFFSVFGARGPPESDFHFQGLCIMPLQGRDSSRKNTFKPIDSEHFCVRIQSSFPV